MKEMLHTIRTKKVIAIAGLLAVFSVGVFVGSTTLFVRGATLPENSANLSTFWRVWKLLNDKYPFEKPPTSEERIQGAIKGLVDSYGDPYTTFFPPQEAKEFQEDVKGEFSGVGMEVGMEDEMLVVIAPLKDSPAEKAGMKPGDRIVAIDTITTDGMSVEKAVSLIRGESGTSVSVDVIRKGESTVRTIAIVRALIRVPVVETRIEGSAFIIELSSFTDKAPELMRQALADFSKSKVKYLVIDLRNNPGGYLDSAVEIGSMFLPEGKIIVRENFGSRQKEYSYRSQGTLAVTKPFEMAIVVNEGSASASEILAGALVEHGKAILVGAQTFGKGSVQELIELSDGSSVKITVAEWLTPDGVSLSKNGLVPTFAIEDNPKTTSDEVIQKAISELRK